MATEPVSTSTHYDPLVTYTPPVGRLPVLGKVRAEVDAIRAAAANDMNQIINRDLAQIDSNANITAQIAALNTRVVNETARNDAEVLNIQGRTTNELQATTNDTTRTGNDTAKVNAEITAMGIASTNDTNRAVQEVAASITNAANDTTRTNNDTSRTSADTTATQIKSEAEVQLLEQKAATELAQTSDVIPTTVGINSTGATRTVWNGTTAVGVIGQQRALIYQQKEGFIRDSEQKISKLVLEAYNARVLAGEPGINSATAGVDDTAVGDVIDVARAGIGLGPT